MGPKRPTGLPASGPEAARRSAGKECKKQMYSASRLRLLRTRLFLAVHDEVSRRHEINGHDDGNEQAPDNGAGQRSISLRSGAELQSHGEQAKDGSQRSHQHRPKTQTRSDRNGFLERLAFETKVPRELHDENA